MALIPAEIRRLIRAQARGLCEYCRCPENHSTQLFSVDHIWPQSRQGTDDADNLALSCQGCNNKKYNKTSAPDPVTGAQAPLYNPRQQRWADHFAWIDEGLTISGLTATGRATVACLELNREGVVNLRGLLLLGNLHPPDED